VPWKSEVAVRIGYMSDLYGQSTYDVAGIPVRSAARGYVGHEVGAESFKPQVVTIGGRV
jgi:hypothetical protein